MHNCCKINTKVVSSSIIFSHMRKGVIAGAFDVIHPGYIDMLNTCKEHCDYLVVCLHQDPNEERPEKLKPILNFHDRYKIVQSLKQIDYVIPYRLESDLYRILADGDFGVRFLGDDYINRSFTGDDLNIPIHYLDRSHGWSATKFKQLIANSINK